jgi:hypothetical protein
VSEPDDEIADRFRAVLGRRHFVDRESGVLLVWVPGDVRELADLVGQVELRHPATSFSVQESGSALAVRMSARDQDLAELEALYVKDAV